MNWFRFNQRLRRKPRAGVDAKEIISLSLSIAAFAVSALTAYLTLLKTTDEMRVAIGSQSPIGIFQRMAGDEGRVSVSNLNYELILINAGNRSMAITDVSFTLSPSSSKALPTQCSSGRPVYYQPVRKVLKPGEILSHQLVLADRQVLNSDNEALLLPVEAQRGVLVAVEGCLTVTVGTPDEIKQIDKPVWKAVYEPHTNDSDLPKLLVPQTVTGPENVILLYQRHCVSPLC